MIGITCKFSCEVGCIRISCGRVTGLGGGTVRHKTQLALPSLTKDSDDVEIFHPKQNRESRNFPPTLIWLKMMKSVFVEKRKKSIHKYSTKDWVFSDPIKRRRACYLSIFQVRHVKFYVLFCTRTSACRSSDRSATRPRKTTGLSFDPSIFGQKSCGGKGCGGARGVLWRVGCLEGSNQLCRARSLV